MKKKLVAVFASLLMAMTASAQYQYVQYVEDPFAADKIFVGASLTGLNLNYNGDDGFNLGVNAHLGYMIYDDLLAHANVSYEHNGSHSVPDYVSVGAGLRYYIMQNGIFLGVNGKFVHAKSNYNDVMPGVEVGYAFFLSRTATIEPAIYYDQSFKNHSDYSTFGFKIGFGLYF